MVTLIRPCEDHTAPNRQHRVRRCSDRLRQVQSATEWLPTRSGLRHRPNPNGEALAGRLRLRENPAPDDEPVINLYLHEIGRVKPLTQRAELELVVRTKRGDRTARERLIKANLRRVVEISREFENLGLPLLDLIGEGNVGLVKAVKRFEPASGSKFATYSTWWIKQSIKRALASQLKAIPQPA
jgi:RNA polymerase primary sigma factor